MIVEINYFLIFSFIYLLRILQLMHIISYVYFNLLFSFLFLFLSTIYVSVNLKKTSQLQDEQRIWYEDRRDNTNQRHLISRFMQLNKLSAPKLCVGFEGQKSNL